MYIQCYSFKAARQQGACTSAANSSGVGGGGRHWHGWMMDLWGSGRCLMNARDGAWSQVQVIDSCRPGLRASHARRIGGSGTGPGHGANAASGRGPGRCRLLCAVHARGRRRRRGESERVPWPSISSRRRICSPFLSRFLETCHAGKLGKVQFRLCLIRDFFWI